MRYLLLIYSAESDYAPEGSQQAQDQMAQWGAYTQALITAGAFKGGEALQPTATATTVRVRNGERLVSDGPFAETKETLGGYYLIEAKDLDEALDWAAKCPAAPYGSMEVRPIMELPPEYAMAMSQASSA